MLLYFLRHGETIWNLERRIQGRTDVAGLTEFGTELAELTREGFEREGITFDRIYSSPLRRAMQTARIIAGDKAAEIIPDDRIIEMNFGIYEGTTNIPGKYIDENISSFFKNPAKFRKRGDGAEDLRDVRERFKSFLHDEIAPLEGKCDRILAVSHGGAMRALISYALGLGEDEYWIGRLKNCSVYIVSCINGCFSMAPSDIGRIYYDPALAAKTTSV